jgi:hypothetical protein
MLVCHNPGSCYKRILDIWVGVDLPAQNKPFTGARSGYDAQTHPVCTIIPLCADCLANFRPIQAHGSDVDDLWSPPGARVHKVLATSWKKLAQTTAI